MTAMRRARAILKYVPAVLRGLLVVAWVVSWWRTFGLIYPSVSPVAESSSHRVSANTPWMAGIGVSRGRLLHWTYIDWDGPGRPHLFVAPYPDKEWRNPPIYYGPDLAPLWRVINFPLLVIVTVALPIAAGCLTRFRFPLWSYFAWTALIAAELAYCLR